MPAPAPFSKVFNASMDLGPCCACSGNCSDVENIVLLRFRAPVPGTGWGCVVCHQPSDGALAVICNRCLESGVKIIEACDGSVTDHKRVPIETLTEPFDHDLRLHQQDLHDFSVGSTGQ